jgi:hypothetical protein
MLEAYFSAPAWHVDTQISMYFPGYAVVTEVFIGEITNERVREKHFFEI